MMGQLLSNKEQQQQKYLAENKNLQARWGGGKKKLKVYSSYSIIPKVSIFQKSKRDGYHPANDTILLMQNPNDYFLLLSRQKIQFWKVFFLKKKQKPKTTLRITIKKKTSFTS